MAKRPLESPASPPQAPAANAVAALFSFHAARFPARVDATGELVLLPDQDRSRYDRALLARGARHLDAAAGGDRLTTWHLEADIASCHSLAASYGETDWSHIVACYDRLMRINPSPTVAVSRAVALARVRGAREAIAELERLRARRGMKGYLPLHLALAASAPTKRHVERRLDSLA